MFECEFDVDWGFCHAFDSGFEWLRKQGETDELVIK